MIIEIPTKNIIKKIVDSSIRKEMGNIYKLLDKYRKRLIEVEEKLKNKSIKIKGINRNEK